MSKRVYIAIVLVVVVVSSWYFFLGKQTDKPQTKVYQATSSGQLENKDQPGDKDDIGATDQCDGKLTPQATEGPYYKANTPMLANLRETGTVGENLTVTGYVFNKNCNPIAGALVDFWQADGRGVYDNSTYKLRGHQFTDEDGKYMLETVVPGEYPGRTPHIHVKVRASSQSLVLTSQLYFPNEESNLRDSIFNPATVMSIEDTSSGKVARYNFVLDIL